MIEDTLKKRFQVRGILQTAIDNGWRVGEWTVYDDNGTQTKLPGWYQPMFNADGSRLMNTEREKPVLGWKNADSKGTPHDTWVNYIPGYKPLMLPKKSILKAIFAAGGTVNMTEGKADTLSMWAARVPNAFGIFGSSFVPDDFADLLQKWEVKQLRFFSHPDEAGRKSAQRVVNLLNQSDIKVEIYALQAVEGVKVDVNDMWQACEFDRDALLDHLRALPQLALTPEPIKIWTPTIKSRPEGLTDDRIHAYGRGVLRGVIGELLTVSSNRNNALNEAAFKIGTWVAAGAIDRNEAEYELEQAAQSIGLWEREAKPTIRSGMKASEGQPADLSKLEAEAKPAKKVTQDPVTQIDVVAIEKGATKAETHRADAPKRDTRVRVMEWGAASANVSEMLAGCSGEAALTILPMPFRSVAKLGGLAEMFLPGKIYAFVADSGMGKTSFIETMVDAWRRFGASGVIWGPEWTPEEYVQRAIQRIGGPSFMDLQKHAVWHAARNAGIPADRNPGNLLKEDELELAYKCLQTIEKWRGRLYFVDKSGITISQLTDAMEAACDEAESQGNPLSFAVADYAQLLDADGDTASGKFMASMSGFKTFCTNPLRKLIGIVGSQITKADGRAALTGEEISHHAMQGGRSDYFNFVMAIGRTADPDGKLSPMATGYISKNSVGNKGNAALYQDSVTAAWRDG